MIERLGDEVRRQAARFGPVGNMARVTELWPAAVGPAVAAHAWPARVGRDGTLQVNTDSSAWAFELSQLAPAVLDQLRAALGDDAPAGLRFAPGPLPERSAGETEAVGSTRPQPSHAERAAAHELTRPIEDADLRALVARAAAASLARPASDRSF